MRDFDGTNDEIDFGSDASIDGFTVRSICLWIWHDANATDILLAKDGNTTSWIFRTTSGSDVLAFIQVWSVTTPVWSFTTALGTGRHHLALTYDGGLTTNDPIAYIDGVVDALATESAVPSVTMTADSAVTLRAGEDGAQALDYDGGISHLVYTNEILTAAEVNRARWFGRPKGGLAVYHPFYTDKLANEGTATAAGTATGTTVVNAARVVPAMIPGTAMMGCGVGW